MKPLQRLARAKLAVGAHAEARAFVTTNAERLRAMTRRAIRAAALRFEPLQVRRTADLFNIAAAVRDWRMSEVAMSLPFI